MCWTMWRIGRKEGRGCRPKQAGVANIHGLRLDPGGNAAAALATDSREAEQRLLICQGFRARVLHGRTDSIEPWGVVVVASGQPPRPRSCLGAGDVVGSLDDFPPCFRGRLCRRIRKLGGRRRGSPRQMSFGSRRQQPRDEAPIAQPSSVNPAGQARAKI